jgi:hypothetical protein
VAEDAFDVVANCGNIRQPSFELWLAQVSRHRIGEGAGILAK